MRSEVYTVNDTYGKEQGPISHALDRIDNFAPASEWTPDHMLRFQVIVLEHQLDVAMFPKQYSVTDQDKTLTAAMKDDFFVNRDFMDHGWSQKLHSNFFIDLMQLKESKSKPISSSSTSLREPYTSLTQNLDTGSIAPKSLKVLQKPHSASYSLIHNFLKYVASMEHLSYPDLPFWCPRYIKVSFSMVLILQRRFGTVSYHCS